MTLTSDEARRLLQEVASGGARAERALRALYDAMQRDYLRQLADFGLAPREAAETAQTFWLDVARHAQAGADDGDPWLWLLRRRHDRAVDALRHKQRAKRTFDGMPAVVVREGEPPPEESIPDPNPSAVPERALMARQFEDCVHAQLQALKKEHPDEVWVAVGIYLEHWSMRTLAAVRRCSEDAARQAVRRMRHLFREPMRRCWDLLVE